QAFVMFIAEFLHMNKEHILKRWVEQDEITLFKEKVISRGKQRKKIVEDFGSPFVIYYQNLRKEEKEKGGEEKAKVQEDFSPRETQLEF
ncbi:MAG: hypothetical protein ACTSUK_07740, partial [Promethearchaeota archaeon]